MRLAQLARKLAVRPADITAFLEENNINVENGSNFRLDDQMVALVMAQFGQTPDSVNTTDPDVESGNEVMDVQDQPSTAEDARPAVEASETVDSGESIELIKAPKVELPGLRVLGKIDLPEPKPKIQEEGNANAETSNAGPGRSPVPRRRQRTDANFGARKNPVTLQREREARESERKRRADEELEKERRRQKYLSKVKINVPTKPARIFDEEVEELEQGIPDEPAKGPWGRFLNWLFRK